MRKVSMAMREELVAAQNNVSDARMEYLIRDRLSWLRFLGIDLGAPTSDAKAFCRPYSRSCTEPSLAAARRRP